MPDSYGCPIARDPVALAIEKYLLLIELEGKHRLSIKERSDGYRVRFAGEMAEANSLDIALVRLASLLLSMEAFRDTLTKTLRGPYAVSQMQDVSAHRQLGRG